MPDSAKRYVVWLCEGCDECDPQDGTPRSQGPCDSPSMNGADVVLAEDHDRLLTIERHRTQVAEDALREFKAENEWASWVEAAEATAAECLKRAEVAEGERDSWIRTFNRLCALVAKHIDAKTPGLRFTHFADEADEALHAGYQRVVKDAPAACEENPT